MPVRPAIELGRRVEYFKGDKLRSFLLNNTKSERYCPKVTCKEEAIIIGQLLLRHGFIHRSDRDAQNRRVLTPSRNHEFTTDGYYTWMYDGSTNLRNFLTACLILGFLICVCFPIWPQWGKVAVWYMSVTFLIFIMIFTIVRLFLFFILWLCGMDFWLLPNVFDDNLSVADSFRPMYSFRRTDASEVYYRVAGFVAFVVFCIWVSQQPTDFDEYMSLTKQFTEDVYSGKLLDDMSQQQREEIDKVKVPDLEDLMREEENDLFTEKDDDQIFDRFMEEKYFTEDKEEEKYFTQDKEE